MTTISVYVCYKMLQMLLFMKSSILHIIYVRVLERWYVGGTNQYK